MSFNKVILMGNLTRDPEERVVSENASVTAFSVAVNETWKDAKGEKRERVAFVDCEAWNKTGQIIGQYFEKGKPILVEGKLQQDTWEDKESGQKRSKLKVNVERFSFCGGGRSDGEGDNEPAKAPAQSAVSTAIPSKGRAPLSEDELPFAPEPGYRNW